MFVRIKIREKNNINKNSSVAEGLASFAPYVELLTQKINLSFCNLLVLMEVVSG